MSEDIWTIDGNLETAARTPPREQDGDPDHGHRVHHAHVIPLDGDSYRTRAHRKTK